MRLLWQPLDQCPIAALQVNLKGWISSGEHELCNLQENSIGNYNSILPTIYIIVLDPCYNFSISTLISIVKIVDGGLYFVFSFHFYFTLLFTFLFSFLFLEQLGLGLISHTVTSVTNWWRSHKTDHETGENGVEGTRIKWRHTAWTTHAGLM